MKKQPTAPPDKLKELSDKSGMSEREIISIVSERLKNDINYQKNLNKVFDDRIRADEKNTTITEAQNRKMVSIIQNHALRKKYNRILKRTKFHAFINKLKFWNK